MKTYTDKEIEQILVNLKKIQHLLEPAFDLQLDFISMLIQLINTREIEKLMVEINSYRMWGKSGVYEDIGGVMPLIKSLQFEEALVNIARILLKYPYHYDGLTRLVKSSEKFIQSYRPR